MALTALVAAIVIAQAQPAWTISVSIEPARESLRYRFDNPSSFNTVELVPHFFEQTYDTEQRLDRRPRDLPAVPAHCRDQGRGNAAGDAAR